MATHTKRQWDCGMNNALDTRRNVRAENLWTTQLLVAPMGRQPDLAQGALLGQNDLRVKHDEEFKKMKPELNLPLLRHTNTCVVLVVRWLRFVTLLYCMREGFLAVLSGNEAD